MPKSLAHQRTDRAIIQAFITLSAQIPFEKMTVQNIMEEALVSRHTFYAHFHDKYEIAERLQEELYEKFLDFMQKRIPKIDSPAPQYPILDAAIWEFSLQSHDKLRAIQHIHTETIDLFGKIRQYIVNHYQECFPKHENLPLEASIYAGMVTAAMEYFVQNASFLPGTDISRPLLQCYIHAALFAIGIHDEKKAEKAETFLSDLAHK